MPLITNGGDHSAESLAVTTAEQLLPIDPAVVDGQYMAHATARLAIAQALIVHHEQHRAAALALVEQDPAAFTAIAGAIAPDVTSALNDVKAAVAGTHWADAFSGGEAERRALSVISTHLATTIHTAVQAAARVSDASEAADFLAQHHGI